MFIFIKTSFKFLELSSIETHLLYYEIDSSVEIYSRLIVNDFLFHLTYSPLIPTERPILKGCGTNGSTEAFQFTLMANQYLPQEKFLAMTKLQNFNEKVKTKSSSCRFDFFKYICFKINCRELLVNHFILRSIRWHTSLIMTSL